MILGSVQLGTLNAQLGGGALATTLGRIIDLVGSYLAVLDMTGSYLPSIDMTGSYLPSIDLIGTVSEN